MPKRQQIAFHGARSSRIHTSFESSGSSHCSQGSASSIRVMAAADGGAKRIGSTSESVRISDHNDLPMLLSDSLNNGHPSFRRYRLLNGAKTNEQTGNLRP